MADFVPAFRKTLASEGGYVNDPYDRGGETFCGISRRHHPGWDGWAMVDAHLYRKGKAADLLGFPMLMEQVAEFYRKFFWERLHLERIKNQDVAEEVFDSAVNAGGSRAAKWLQHACNLVGRASLVEDGIIGPITVETVNKTVADFGAAAMLTTLKGLQFGHYHEIVMRDAMQLKFFRGWLRRV